MKKSLPTASLAALLLVSLPLTATLTGCKGSSEEPEWTEPVEIVTLPELTIPEKPDERLYTDLTPYTDRLDGLFANTTPAPAEDFTYTVVGEGMPDAFVGTVTITGYTGSDSVVIIPDTIEGAPVTAIAEGAFAENTVMRAVSIPDSVTSIAKGAFKGCKGLTSMKTPVFTCQDAPYFGALFGAETYEANGYTVPTGLSTLVISGTDVGSQPISIPKATFYACRNLEVVDLAGTVTEIGEFAFYGCQSLVYIGTAETVLTSVGRNAFTNCRALLTMELPATVETLGFAMLEGCGKLESLTLPFAGGHRVGYTPSEESEGTAETTYLGYLFGSSDYTLTKGFLPASLISVTLLEGCGDVAPNAFFECSPLREVHLPDGVSAIGRRAFYGCEGMIDMTLPDTVTSLGDDAFGGCLRLTSFHGGQGLKTLGVQAFMNCLSLKTVTLPTGVTSLPNSCFAGCISLESLIADGVTSQGKQVFRHCDRLGAPWVTAPSSPSESSQN